MIALLRRLRFLRVLNAQLEAARGERIQMEEALRKEIRAHEATSEELHAAGLNFEQERTRRIAAETVASERRAEIDRMLEQNRELREDLRKVNAERLHSVDSLNVRLMKESVPEPAPDMDQYRRKVIADVSSNLVRQAQATHRKMDMAILQKFHPQFRNMRPMNETISDQTSSVSAEDSAA